MREGWRTVKLGSVFSLRSERVGTPTPEPPVFSVTKHDGVVLASDYFDRRVASDSLANYKLLGPGHWAYSTIHIDEGSIARNNLGIAGAVSPMYTTMNFGRTDHDAAYFELLLRSVEMLRCFSSFQQGSINRRRSLPWKAFSEIEVQVPSLPEQRRIVDLVGALDFTIAAANTASASLASKRASSNGVEGPLLALLLSDATAPRRKVSALGTVTMGRQRSPEHATGTHMAPYLRVANVRDDALRMSNVLMMNFTPAERLRYSIQRDDILLSEGQSLELVGESVHLVDPLPEEMYFQNTLIRFRPDQAQVRPAFAQALFRAAHRAGVFSGISKRTTTIAHLGTQRFAELELPVPGFPEQDRFLGIYEPLRDTARSLGRQIASLESSRTNVVTVLLSGQREIPESYDELMGAAQ